MECPTLSKLNVRSRSVPWVCALLVEKQAPHWCLATKHAVTAACYAARAAARPLLAVLVTSRSNCLIDTNPLSESTERHISRQVMSLSAHGDDKGGLVQVPRLTQGVGAYAAWRPQMENAL